MARLESYDIEDLRRLLDGATGRETVQQLMLAIAYKDGATVHELATRYGLSVDGIDEWFDRLETRARGGQAVADLERLSVSQRARTPVGGSRSDATVEYLQYDVVSAAGWALEDEDLFAKAADRDDLDADEYGTINVPPDESILEAAEEAGVDVPFACRGGACSNCAVYLYSGSVAMSGDHVLPAELIREESIRLACVGTPTSESVQLVYGVDHLDALRELTLPAEGFHIPDAN
jgi:ferredoxin